MRLFQPGFSRKYLSQFADLHGMFSQIMAMTPWRYVSDLAPVAVRNPANGQLYYILVMDEWEDRRGFIVLDEAGMSSWEAVQSEILYDDEFTDEFRLQQYCELTQVKKSELEPDHLLAYQTAGILPGRGRNCMLAISQEPGYPPGLIGAARLDELVQVLPGFVFLLEQFRDGLLDNPEHFEDTEPIVAASKDESGSWCPTEVALPCGDLPALPKLPDSIIRKFIAPSSLPDADEGYVVHASVSSGLSVNSNGRSYYPVAILLVGVKSRRLLGLRIMEYDDWRDRAIPHLMALIAATGEVPPELHLIHDRVENLVDVATDLLLIGMDYSDEAILAMHDVLESVLEEFNATDFTPH